MQCFLFTYLPNHFYRIVWECCTGHTQSDSYTNLCMRIEIVPFESFDPLLMQSLCLTSTWMDENMKIWKLSLENNFLLQNFSHFRIFIIFDFNCIEIIIKLTKPTLHKMVSMKQWTQSQWWWSFGGFFV